MAFAIPERLGRRAGSILLTTLVQAAFVLALLSARPPPPPHPAQRETILLLPARPRTPSPPQPLPPHPRQTTGPPAILPPVMPALPSAPAAPPPGIAGFGRALFGCAPEKYADLLPDDRARCPPPGEGMAILHDPNLMGGRSHVKDEAHWQAEWAREQSPALLPCGGFTNPLCLLGKIADGTLSDYGDPARWPNYAVKQLPAGEFYKIEQAYKAWRKEHGSGEAVGVHPQAAEGGAAVQPAGGTAGAQRHE